MQKLQWSKLLLILFDQKYSKNNTIVKYDYNFKQLFSILIFF